MSEERPPAAGRRDGVLTVSDVALIFHVSPKTIVRWANEGKLPYSLTLGGHRRFQRADVEAIAITLERPGGPHEGGARSG